MVAVIPRRFHRIWFGPRSMPERYAAYGRAWSEMNGWPLVDHGYDSLPGTMLNQAEFTEVAHRHVVTGGAKANSVVQVQQADIASYEILWAEGGIYLNCDMEPLRPIDELLGDASCVIAWEQDHEFPSNAFMASTPGHPFIGEVLRLLPHRFRVFEHQPINEQTGPHLLRQALREYDGDDVVMVPSKLLMPFDFNHTEQAAVEHPDAYAVHHWGHRIPDTDLWGGA